MVTESARPNGLNEVLLLIGELARKSEGRNYIYRGENREYPQVSSTLYRLYPHIDAPGFDITVVQDEMLAQARSYARYMGALSDFEILSQIQHNHGATNLIDFTSDYLIALFFACDGEPDASGRVILLSETGDDYHIDAPINPAHRVIAQKSIFVTPYNGFVEPDDLVVVDKNLKPEIMSYLRDCHGVSTEAIYNDLLGFIRHQSIHQSDYIEFYAGLSFGQKGNHEQAKAHFANAIMLNPHMSSAYSNLGVVYGYQRDYRQAVEYFNKAIGLGPDNADADWYANRGEAWLHLSAWDNAMDDLAIARDKGADIIAWFRHDYASVDDFKKRNGITEPIPPDLVEMLGG